MTSFKILLLAAIALLLVVIAMLHSKEAEAGTTCTVIGNTTYCRDSQGNTATCTVIGNTTYCN